MNSRAVLILGMHRSGTSAIARGVRALSVDLGHNFFEPQPDNPTGYWEDKTVVEINQRVLEELRLKWDDAGLIQPQRFGHHRIRLLKLKAVRYLKSAFGGSPLWGFKDPRAIRLLPFWSAVLDDLGVEDSYVFAVRHPRSVAASLFRRQEIKEDKAQRLWLVHTVPFLRQLRGKRLAVVDYDLIAAKPHAQLERIARKLGLPVDDEMSREIDRFAAGFLDQRLRHSVFATHDFTSTTDLARLTETAYLALHDLATDRLETPSASFWECWESMERRLEALVQTA